MYASLPGRAGQNTNTNTIPNDGNDILAKVQTQVHQRRTVLLTVRLVFECVPTMAVVPGHIN
jgi:hypothetical protein